jgi:hypothetical protein
VLGLKRLQGFLPSEVSELTATVSVEGGGPEGGTSHEGRFRAADGQGSQVQRTGVVTLIDEDLLDWNIFLDRTSSTTALVLSVRRFFTLLEFF